MDDDGYPDEEDAKISDEKLVKTDEELCAEIQSDLENFIEDQKKRKSMREYELRLFHSHRDRVIRAWTDDIGNRLMTMAEDMAEALDEQYEHGDIDDEKFSDGESENEREVEELAHRILFDVVVECYDVAQIEYAKIEQNEYVNGKSIDMVWMNVDVFYQLLLLIEADESSGDAKKQRKARAKMKRIGTIIKYVGQKIQEISSIVKKKYAKYMECIDSDKLSAFVVQCVRLLWSVLYYKYAISPLTYSPCKNETYNDEIHLRKGGVRNEIECCIFPAITQDAEYITKIWVICGDQES